MEITKHLFLNLSILIILLFFYLICFDKYKKLLTLKPILIFLFTGLIWVCVQLSYNPVPFSHYDLRIIPLVIGGLYLGMGPILVLALLIIRSFYGWDIGLLETSILYGPLAIVFWLITPWYWKQSSSRRILIAVLLGMILGILTIGGMELFHPYTNWIDAWFAFLVIPPLGIAIVSYAIEFVKKNNQMRLQLIKTEKLKAVEQMGAAISHEIRNPLTAASGFVQLLQDDYLPRHKRREYLALVRDELLSAERVIQDYLTFAKPALEAYEELNVKSELKQIINILQPLANQNSVEINTDFSVIGFIKGDQQKFRQCFINVLKNAIESMPNGGYLSLKTEYDQEYVSVTVKDTGVGMTKEQLERLGEPFYSTKGSKGTGLGMMVVYSIVRAMGGWIRVESEVEAGTVFHFHFPAIRPYRKAENQ
ncbi:HAMP domain-containing histidine kinase [Bacillus salipaludis]|uniref:histidine kinase n=1 Tax=Bacillus salipaludis TaxID=2547811 RepID=A0A4V3AT53_9BACI|nr:HAMP domain-containing sensor histidine kinase [Bacillus salipaludis]MDQ6596276.1 HAMP domain-containing sensor histidine kinase [Bacillus salipaludis]TDK58406.1 HAMP domain-containing histidine kinase [Bacillus salipaludis]